MGAREWPKLSSDGHAAAEARTRRWEARKEHRNAGGKMLSLGDLGAAIKVAHAEAEAAESEIVRAAILLRIEDMEREFHWHSYHQDDVTDWPDDPEWLGGATAPRD
jgi:hypothetical protein